MNLRHRPITALIAILFLARPLSAIAQTDPQRVARQFREYCLAESTQNGDRILDDVDLPKTSVSAAMRLISEMRPDGSWTDIDYASADRSVWPSYTQLTRILSIVVQARRSGTSQEDAAQCIAAAHHALGFWIQHDYQCPNWWFNQIGVPKVLGNIALLLDTDLTPPEKSYIANVALPRAKVGAMTGQNRTWLAGIGVMRAALLDDDALLAAASRVIRDEIKVSTDEGVQPDWSFHQHGPQQQFGNYGMAYAVEMSRWITVLRGTRYAITGPQLELIRNYLLQGQSWIAWRGTMDISSCGRQLSPNSPHAKVATLLAVFRTMTLADPADAADYQAYITRNQDNAPNDLIGNRCFYRSDFIVHRRPDWMATLKMYSARVIGGETVNSENLSGTHLADGVTFFYETGHEYDDIFPAWDWRKIPGTTAIQTTAPLTWSSKSNPLPKTTFVGGASDGTNAAAAMDFSRDGITAKKSWFFIGDAVACLGADISSTGPDPVITTINQCLLHGPVTFQQDSQQKNLSESSAQLGGVNWVQHDNLRYTFPTAKPLTLSAAPRTGNWKSVFNTAGTPKPNVTKNIFTLTLDHGPAPQAAAYAYIVTPPTTDAQITILANSPKLQAVASPNLLAAIFWSPGSATLNGQLIAVDEPCILLETISPTNRQITIADPTQKLKHLTIKIDNTSKQLSLPQNDQAGESLTLTLDKAAP